MFIDINLKAASRADMFGKLKAAGFIEGDNTIYHPQASIGLLPEGTVIRKTGEMITGPNGVEIEKAEVVPGYHANVRTTDAALAAALEPVTVVVETPQYVWASDPASM